MKGLTFYDKQHIQKILAQQSEVANIFNRFILSITPFLQQWANRSSDNVWLRNQVVEICVDRELDKLQSLLLTNLTVTEREILKLMALGKTTKEIAAERFLSVYTVMTHRKNIFRKLEVNNVHEATKYALRAGIVDVVEYYI